MAEDLDDDGELIPIAPMRCPNCDGADMVTVLDHQRGWPIWFCGACHWEDDGFDWPEDVPTEEA